MTVEALLARNRAWSERQRGADPEFFSRLARQQKPEYLWIGCSDSRVAANQILDLAPGEVFTHRNVANVVASGDLNCLAVLQFAVDVLRVRHVMVVGHYGCSGIRAALVGQRLGVCAAEAAQPPSLRLYARLPRAPSARELQLVRPHPPASLREGGSSQFDEGASPLSLR